MTTTLNDRQSELLRQLYKRAEPLPVDEVDGRVVRALRQRDLVVVEEDEGTVRLSEAGRTEYERKIRRRRAVGSHLADLGARTARAEAIHRALDALDRAFPRDVLLPVGDTAHAADDVLTAIRAYARRLEGRG